MDEDETHGMEYGDVDTPPKWYMSECYFCLKDIEEDGEEINDGYAHNECIETHLNQGAPK
jgi:hypothetical protein